MLSLVVAALGLLSVLMWKQRETNSQRQSGSMISESQAHTDAVALQESEQPLVSLPGTAPSGQAHTDRKQAEFELLEAERSWQNTLPRADVRKLADQGDSIAQEIMAVRVLAESPDEALQFALRASNSGRPAAAILAAQIIAEQKHEVAEGLLLLDTFQEQNGPSPLVAGYRRSYLAINQLTQEEIMSDYRLLKSNRELGARQKYPLTAASDFKAPAHPAPP